MLVVFVQVGDPLYDFFSFRKLLKDNIFGFCHHQMSTKKLLAVYLENGGDILKLSGVFLFE